MSVARLEGVTKAFGGRPVLAGVSLDIAEGEIVALLGHNGSGKTTLLRILATTVLPDTGTVEIAGVDALRRPVVARRHVGVTLADERAWYWRLTGRANVEFFAALHGMRRRAASARAVELLELVGLTDDADRPFGEYSSGMRLRLSLARALLGDPRLLLLDEPTRSIDPPGAEQFRAMLAGYVASTGAAALIASHDFDEVEMLAARGMVLNAGRVPEPLDVPISRAGLEAALGMVPS